MSIPIKKSYLAKISIQTNKRVNTETDESSSNNLSKILPRSKLAYRAKYLEIFSKPTLTKNQFNLTKPYKIQSRNNHQRMLKTQPNQSICLNFNKTVSDKEEQTSRYRIQGIAGKGTFGVVYIGLDRKTGKKIAIKKVLQDPRYKNRELHILKILRHSNVLEMRDHFLTKDSNDNNQYLNVVMDYYSDNLFEVISKSPLDQKLIKIYTYQILRGLFYLSAISIAHRDIKPHNILINALTNQLVICDFGSAKQLVQNQQNICYICSRCYRAPQLIFGCTKYTCQIDMWSLGCIIIEMINGRPPFVGRNQTDQLISIIKFLGKPTIQQVMQMNNKYQKKDYQKIPQSKGFKLESVFKADPKLIDLLKRILKYSPKERITPKQALLHQYFDEIKNEKSFNKLKSALGCELPNNFIFDFSKQERSILTPNQLQLLRPSWIEKVKKEGQSQIIRPASKKSIKTRILHRII